MSRRIRILLSVILLMISLFIFGHGTGSLSAVQKAAKEFLLMLQDFASKDIVGIV